MDRFGVSIVTMKWLSGTDFLNHPRISTADGVEASLFVGKSILLNGFVNEVGLKAAFFPRARNDSTDLFALISLSQLVTNQTGLRTALSATSVVSIQTNMDIAARVQVPRGSGLLLLDGDSVGAARKRFGALIELP